MSLFVLLLALLPIQDAPGPGPYDLEFVEVVDSVYVAYRPDATRLPVHGNSTIIVNKHDVIVVDAGGSPASAQQIIAHIRSLTSNPVSVLINTHGHEDHILGNQVFLEEFPDIEIIARQGTRDYLTSGRVQGRVQRFPENISARRATGEAEIARLMEQGSPRDEAIAAYLRQYYEQDMDIVVREYERVRITPPMTTFDTKLVFVRAGRTIELLNLGPGKAGSAVVVYLPAERVVIAGDVVTHPIPYGFARDPAGWLDTMKRLADLDVAYLIPGHGDVLSGTSYLRQVIDLVEFELNAVAGAVDRGLDAEAARAQIDFSVWQKQFTKEDPILDFRFASWFVEPAVVRAHQALTAASDQ